MQFGEDLDAFQRAVDVGVELVFDVEVLQRLLDDEGLGLGAQPRGVCSAALISMAWTWRHGRIVADGHRRRDQRPALAGGAGVVLDRVVDQHGIGDRHFLVAHVDDLGRQGAHFLDHAGHLADADEVADLERPRVDQHQAAHQLGDDAGRAERQHEAEHDRQALEGIAVGDRQVGIGDGDADRPDQDTEQAPRGMCRIPMHAGNQRTSLIDILEDVAGDVVGRLGDEKDDADGQQPGNRRRPAPSPKVSSISSKNAGQSLGQRLGQRKIRQHIGEPQVGDGHPERQQEQLRDPFDQQPAMRGPAQLGILVRRQDRASAR